MTGHGNSVGPGIISVARVCGTPQRCSAPWTGSSSFAVGAPPRPTVGSHAAFGRSYAQVRASASRVPCAGSDRGCAVDEEPRPLAEDEDRVQTIDGVDQEGEPPPMEKNQNDTGITLSFLRSDAIHCTRKRMERMPAPRSPRQPECSVLIMVNPSPVFVTRSARVPRSPGHDSIASPTGDAGKAARSFTAGTGQCASPYSWLMVSPFTRRGSPPLPVGVFERILHRLTEGFERLGADEPAPLMKKVGVTETPAARPPACPSSPHRGTARCRGKPRSARRRSSRAA